MCTVVESCGETGLEVGPAGCSQHRTALPGAGDEDWELGLHWDVSLGLCWDVGLGHLFGLVSYQVGCLDGPVFTPCQHKTMNSLLNDL